MGKKSIISESNITDFIIKYNLKKIISEHNSKKPQILKEDCVKSSVKLDPNTGKLGYFDSVTGKPCKPNANLFSEMKNWTEKFPCVPKHEGAKQVRVKATERYGPIAYDLQGYRYFDSGIKWSKKTNGVKFSCNDPVFKRTLIKGTRTPIQIANFLKSSDSWDDDEPGAEKAFSEIRTWDRYNLVKKYLGQDPYRFVSKFIDVNEKYGNIQSITTSYKLLKSSVGGTLTPDNFNKMCPVTVTSQKPGGPKQYLGNVNFMKYFKGGVGTPGADPLLYSNGLTGTYAKVPKDFGWSLNNSIYPYPKYYSQQCIDTATTLAGTNVGDKLKTNESEIKEILPTRDSETTRVQLPTKDIQNFNFSRYPEAGKKKKQMMDYNQALSKQKELIPKFCATPLEREWRAGGGSEAARMGEYKFRVISMYNLCKDYGGLWVYGVGTSKYTCGCRDNSNPALNVGIKTDTGTLNVNKSIQDQQGSTNWSNVDARTVLWGAAALGAAFIPVVGPFVSAGIGLGGAVDLWTSNKKREAAITAFFSLLPMIGKIPGIGNIGKGLAEELKTAVLNNGALTEKQLETLISIIKWDEQVSEAVIGNLEKQGLGKVQQHVLNTAIKKTEEKLVDLTGLPTYGELKKKTLKSVITPVVRDQVG